MNLDLIIGHGALGYSIAALIAGTPWEAFVVAFLASVWLFLRDARE